VLFCSITPLSLWLYNKKVLQIKQIFNKYVDEVSRFQYRNFFPVSTLNLNDENKKTVIKLDIEDYFISKNIEYYIEGKIVPLDATKTYDSKSNIKLVDNSVANFFPQIEVKKTWHYYRRGRFFRCHKHSPRMCILFRAKRI
jgi:hypothetical protein